MLEPQTRVTLTELLHPPAGFVLAHAVATTFTLDLDTALTIPLSLAARRVTTDDDPIGILDAVRRAADRVDIFAQAGEIGVGVPPSALLAFLEPMVHPVRTPRGIFHPKVWFLEFEHGDDRAYRFVCASRNLTADRSWDVVVALDGVPAGRGEVTRARAVNAPLVRLLRALPRLAVTSLPTDRAARVEALAVRLRDVAWELPPGVHDVAFHVWGLGRRPEPAFGGVRGLVVSPYVTDAGLAEVSAGVYRELTVVSRATSLGGLSRSVATRRGTSLFVLDDAASAGSGAADGQPGGPVTGDGLGARASSGLTGLHAKVYVFDRRDGAHVLLGSLNATGAALHANVETMVELRGETSSLGVRATREALDGFVEEFVYQGSEGEPTDVEEADRALDAALRAVAGLRWEARVVRDEDGYALAVRCDAGAELEPGTELEWSPVTRTGVRVPGLPQSPVVVRGLDLVDISPFLVVHLRDARGERSARTTVVVAELTDDPPERRDAVVAGQLTDQAAFVRFLVLLLELGGVALPQGLGGGGWYRPGAAAQTGAGLFEALVRAVGRRGDGLADVQRVVEQVLRTDAGDSVLPDGFDRLWAAVWSAQQRLTGSAGGDAP